MSASRYPYLFATLGEAANTLPDELAQPLEITLAAQQTDDGITLLGSLRRIRQVDAADGQPLQRNGRTAGQCMATKRSRSATTWAKASCWPAAGCPNMWMCRCMRPEALAGHGPALPIFAGHAAMPMLAGPG
nr:hypothetical protein [Stenotrophomonas pavanii]